MFPHAAVARSCRAGLLKASAQFLRGSNQVWTECLQREQEENGTVGSVCNSFDYYDAFSKVYDDFEKLRTDSCPWDDSTTTGSEAATIYDFGSTDFSCNASIHGACDFEYYADWTRGILLPAAGWIGTCAQCQGESQGWILSSLFYRNFVNQPPDGGVARCQQVLASASNKYLQKRSKAIEKCLRQSVDGPLVSECRASPGSSLSTLLDKYRTSFVKKVCGACGGPDGSCDGLAGGVAGSGGSDDIAAGEIGMPATCIGVESPVTGRCYRTVASVSDLVSCASCVTESMVDCGMQIAAPWAGPLDAACGGDGSARVLYAEDFDGLPQDAWPSPWVAAAEPALADTGEDAARLEPRLAHPSEARMYAANIGRDVDVRIHFRVTDAETQGWRLSLRDDGAGNAYRVQLRKEGGVPVLRLQRVLGGVVTDLASFAGIELQLWNDAHEWARFRISTEHGAARLQASSFMPGNYEPDSWQVDALDSSAGLQVTDGIAFESFSSLTPDNGAEAGIVYLEDIAVQSARNPLDRLGPAEVVASGFVAADGPLWRDTTQTLLLTDHANDAVYEFDPIAQTISSLALGLNGAAGLALDPDGRLLAAEYGARDLVRAEADGTTTVLADRYQDLRLNSPHDVATDGAGHVYFSDPSFGVADADREQFFNQVYRLEVDGTLERIDSFRSPEQPVGIELTRGGTHLFVADPANALLRRYHIEEPLFSYLERGYAGYSGASGICSDPASGTLFVGMPDGLVAISWQAVKWATVALPEPVTNCAVAGDGLQRTLYVTTASSLYRMAYPEP
ncbi:MAG TPA: SMP-30/gluconolactonase/LRE family protein [Candidatus Limnocylindrales bacterium]|nr:SMP-30/gluconolactonase/LRE family protein [Candidatus Limnocylindrales bacterium]